MFLLAPTWGATAMTLDSGALNRISTHAPAWGATPTGADIQHLYGNKYRRQVKADAIGRLGIQDNRPAYLMASNITKDGKTYYLDVTKASLNKMRYTEKGSPLQIERLLLIDNLEKAIDSSYWVESSGDRKDRQQVNGFDTLWTSFCVDGDPYYADIKVKVVQSGRNADAQNVVYFLEPVGAPVIKRADDGSPTAEQHARSIIFGDQLSAGVEGTRPLNVK